MEDLLDEEDLEIYEPKITADQNIEEVKQALNLKQKYESKTLISKKTLQADRNKAKKGKLQSMVSEAKKIYSKNMFLLQLTMQSDFITNFRLR